MDLPLIITFGASAISGVAGIFVHRYISRAKPKLNVTSLSFEGDVIEINEEVQNLSRKCNWTDSITRYISYEELSKNQIEIAQVEAALQQEKENVDKWMEHFLADGIEKQFSVGLMMRSPLIEDLRVFVPYLRGMLKRRETPEFSTAIEKLKDLPDIFPVEVTNEHYKIHCGNFAIPFKREDYSEDIHDYLELLVYSISKGDFSNYMKIHEHFSIYAGSQLYNYQKIMKSVKEHLVLYAKLSLKVSISNLGQTPIIIKPYFAAKLVFGEKSKSMVLENIDKSADKDRIPFTEIVRSNQYQKSSTSTNYVSIPPGDSVQVNLVSSDGLGNESNEIAEFYELGGLKGQVFANSESGKVIKSNLTYFSKSISEAEKKALIITAT